MHAYPREIRTHSEAAEIIQRGQADAAIALHAAASQHNLDFIPLYTERYDLAFPDEQAELLHPLLDFLQAGAYRREVESLAGYESRHTGEQVL